MREINYKLSAYILDQVYGFSKQDLGKVEIICYEKKLYVPQTLCRRVIYWYHFYINRPGGSRLTKTIERCASGKDF